VPIVLSSLALSPCLLVCALPDRTRHSQHPFACCVFPYVMFDTGCVHLVSLIWLDDVLPHPSSFQPYYTTCIEVLVVCSTLTGKTGMGHTTTPPCRWSCRGGRGCMCGTWTESSTTTSCPPTPLSTKGTATPRSVNHAGCVTLDSRGVVDIRSLGQSERWLIIGMGGGQLLAFADGLGCVSGGCCVFLEVLICS